MSAAELRCWNCGAGLDAVPRPISRHEQCPGCFEALHCCRLCHHYRAEVTGSCDEDRADPPVVKENANFCDWFRPDAGAFSGERTTKAGSAKDRLQALFGAEEAPESSDGETEGNAEDQPPASKEASARTQLDDLFK